MSTLSDHLATTARELRHRCHALHLAAWTVDARGRIAADPAADGLAGTWTQDSAVRDLVVTAAREALRTKEPTIEPFAPGAWLLSAIHRNSSDEVFVTICLAFDAGRWTDATFARLAGDGRRPAPTDLESFCGFDENTVPCVARTIRWWHDDLARALDAEAVNAGLLRELDSSFEQISTLYRIARSMNCLHDPRQFVSGACHQLSFLLGFEWAAVQYVDSPYELPDLGQVVSGGALPCAEDEFARLALVTLQYWHSDHWTQVLEPSEHDMARELGTPVLVEPITHDDTLIGALFLGGLADRPIDTTDLLMTDTVGDFMGTFHQNAMRFAVQEQVFRGTVKAFASALDAKDAYTRGHSERVAQLAVQLARATGLAEPRCDVLYIAGLLHDIGKIGVPESILGKVGPLTDEEFAQIKLHPVIGHAILRDIPTMNEALPGVLHHHESWDGSGYPRGLAGEDIPLFGRLLAVADAFDAMSSDRAYRARMDRETVRSILRNGSGRQWDPTLIAVFLELDLTPYDELLTDHAAREPRAA